MPEYTATATDTATKAKPYVCTTCTRPFARLEHLKRHERSHTKEKPFCCEQAGAIPGCGRRFARRDLLLRHQQKIHLFPNTSKRRRLSSVSTSSASTAQKKSVDMRESFVISIPNIDDLTNFENGTVNPSSIYSASPPTSVQPNTMQSYMDSRDSCQVNLSNNGPAFSYATEKLFPIDHEMMQSDLLHPQGGLWALPELSIGIASPTSTVSSSYSPTTTYGSLGRASSLEMAGTDSELFSPDFFVGGGGASYHPTVYSQDASQLFLNTQLDQMAATATSSSLRGKHGYRMEPEMASFQFAGGEQAYCNGFRPMQQQQPLTFVNHHYVESF